MSDDYRVKGRSDDEVRALAKRLQVFFRTANRYPVNVLACLRRDSIWTVFGVKRLIFNVLPDAQMGKDDAHTRTSPSTVIIEARASVVTRATMGVGRDRQTFAHELGHAVMHKRPMMGRGTGAAGNTTPAYIKPFESAEHQAKIFGAAFLIVEALVEDFSSAEDISTQFGVSLESARIYFEGIEEVKRRKESTENIDRMVDEFRNLVMPSSTVPNYLSLACPKCGHQTLRPIGIKIACDTCDYMRDLPDGDTAA